MRVTITEAPIGSDEVLENLKKHLQAAGILYEIKEIGSDTFSCDICGKGFGTLNAVNSHKVAKHPPSLRCQICKVDMRSQRELDNHVKGKRHLMAVNQMKYKDIKVYESCQDVQRVDDNVGNRK